MFIIIYTFISHNSSIVRLFCVVNLQGKSFLYSDVCFLKKKVLFDCFPLLLQPTWLLKNNYIVFLLYISISFLFKLNISITCPIIFYLNNFTYGATSCKLCQNEHSLIGIKLVLLILRLAVQFSYSTFLKIKEKNISC